MAMSFGLTTASAIFFFREKFGNVITKGCHVVRIILKGQQVWGTGLYFSMITRRLQPAKVAGKFESKILSTKIRSYRGGNKQKRRKFKLCVATTYPSWIYIFNTMLVLIRQERWHSRDAIPCSQPTEASYSATIIQAVYKLSFPISSDISFVFCEPKCQQNCISWTSVKHQAGQLTF